MPRRKICVVTSSRAEYGLLYWLMKEIKADPDLCLQIIVTGMHLSPEFGLTYRVIEKDGYDIDAKVEMLLSSDTSVGIAKAIGLGVIGFADAFDRLKPDILILLGDRYEIFAAAQVAMVSRIPISHIAGGDTTEGAFDEAVRHSLTKMAHIHFVTNDISEKRVRQLGENSKYIFNVGSTGLDYIKRLKVLAREELEEALDFKLRTRNLLITFHPVTLDVQSSSEQFQQLLEALDGLGSEFGLIFTKSNADTEGRILGQMIDEFISEHSNAKTYTSLGQTVYLSTIAHVDAVVGNSSSGIYEAPSFKKPTINIGDRQKGRLQASSVINCSPEKVEILRAIEESITKDYSDTINPYGDGDSSKRIVRELKQITDFQSLLKKHFFELY